MLKCAHHEWTQSTATIGSESLTPKLRDEMIAALPRVRRFARSLAASDAIGDELTQQTIERALVSIASLGEGVRADSWMYRIAHGLWTERNRGQRSRGNRTPARNSFDDGQAATAARLTMLDIREAIADLPDDQRVLVMLVLVDGRPCHEAAELLEIPVETATSRLSLARATLEARVFG